ncbi:MAG: helix-turn-helix transcriptional regulator [Lachnospiraceae bacterium]|nr:helix-turn-helix transcriptional regulator [Lachnospiraceae bacterium]
MDIASKIRNSRTEARLTQEQAAEHLGVSRQTISNWETGKSYPDIVSVLKMSDIYGVSLDYLLKGEEPMKTYVEYLEESTNTVKSRTRLSKLITIAAYLVVWALAIVAFWCFTDGSDAMGYALIFLWIVLPVTTFVTAFLIGRNDFWGVKKWWAAPVLGLAYMLAEYATFSMSNNLAFDKVNTPHWSLLIAGAVIAAAGLGLGQCLHAHAEKRQEE